MAASSMLRPGALYSQFNNFPLIISPISVGNSMFGDSRLYPLNPTLKCSRNSPILSLIRAQELCRTGKSLMLHCGMGAQNFTSERQDGSEIIEIEGTFVPKVKLEIVVIKDQVKDIIDKIITEARVGENGDGKIFVMPISDVIRVRTGEQGEKAERMKGWRPDIFFPEQN